MRCEMSNMAWCSNFAEVRYKQKVRKMTLEELFAELEYFGTDPWYEENVDIVWDEITSRILGGSL